MVPMTYTFPAGVFVYWITTNVFSFCQMMALKVPLIKKLCGMPDVPTGYANPASMPSVAAKKEITKKFGAAPQLHGVNPKVGGLLRTTRPGPLREPTRNVFWFYFWFFPSPAERRRERRENLSQDLPPPLTSVT
jgi:hypothetical protein